MSPFPRAATAAAWLIGCVAVAAARADEPPVPVRLGSARLRHDCTGLDWAPDGKSFVSVGIDGSIRVWDPADGTELRRFKAKSGFTCSALFDPEGKRLLAGDVAGVAHVLDAATGAELHALKAPPQQVVAVAWRPDGTAATLSRDGVIRIWDLTTEKIKRQYQCADPSLQSPVRCEVLSRDGGRHAVWVREKDGDVLTVWDGEGKELFHAPTGLPIVDGLAFSGDGKTLAVLSGFGAPALVALWDVDAGKEIRRFENLLIVDRTVAFSRNGTYFAGRAADGAMRVWGAASGKELRRFDAPQQTQFYPGQTLAFSPDGKRLVGVQGSQIHVWDVATGAETPGFVGHMRPVEGVRFSDDGRTVLTCGFDRAVGRWDAATGKLLTWRTPPDGGSMPLFPLDGKTVVLARSGNLYRWDPDADQAGPQLLLAGWQGSTNDLAVSSNGKTLLVRGRDAFFHIWDDNGNEKAKVKMDQPFAAPAFALSPDGRFVATGSFNAATRLWDAATGAEVRTFSAAAAAGPATPGRPPMPVRGASTLVFSPDGRTLLSVWSNELTLWETATGRERLHGTLPAGATRVLAFSPDGRLVVAGASGGLTTLLDAADGKVLAELPGDVGGVHCLAFAPDGTALAAGGEDGTALVWDLKAFSKRKDTEVELPAERLTALWDDLQDADAGRAYKAILTLAASPKAAAPFLKDHAVKGPDESRVARLIKELDDDSFDVREDAEKELIASGLAALPAVQKAIDAGPSAEARQRLQRMLDKHKGVAFVPEGVRGVRAVEALERSGAPEAAEALRTLAKEAENDDIKQGAAAALERMGRRMGGP